MIWKITLYVLAAVSVGLMLYVLFGRDWLVKIKEQQELNPAGPQWAVRWFAFWEPWEIFLYRKSETILKARFLMVTGALLTVLTQTSEIDWTLLMPFIPEKYKAWVQFAINMTPLILTVLGGIDEKLRRETTKPLELVAIREEDVPPEVRAAIIAAEAAKQAAVAEVVVAKAEGKVAA